MSTSDAMMAPFHQIRQRTWVWWRHALDHSWPVSWTRLSCHIPACTIDNLLSLILVWLNTVTCRRRRLRRVCFGLPGLWDDVALNMVLFPAVTRPQLVSCLIYATWRHFTAARLLPFTLPAKYSSMRAQSITVTQAHKCHVTVAEIGF